MKESILIVFLLSFLLACENNKGQYRHDKNHHEKVQQNTFITLGKVKQHLLYSPRSKTPHYSTHLVAMNVV